MDGNLSEMLSSVLSDPDAMTKLKGVAENLMGNNTPQEHEESSDSKQTPPSDHHNNHHSNDERIALISALRPYLSNERRQTADTLIKLLKVIKLTDITKLLKE